MILLTNSTGYNYGIYSFNNNMFTHMDYIVIMKVLETEINMGYR